GHSQGSSVLIQLIKNEIDGKPVQDRIVSALLLGMNVAVPIGKDVGGAFQKKPLCRAANQTGCVISYVTFRQNAPPPATHSSVARRAKGWSWLARIRRRWEAAAASCMPIWRRARARLLHPPRRNPG